MKEITIPEGFKPFKVVINAVEYAFTPGETVTVPDNVAECVEAYINANQDVTPEAQHQVYMLTFKPDDAGKALVVNENGTDLVWVQVQGGANLPDIIEGDGGKVLKVNESETEAEWANCLPEIMYEDAGKVLTVNASGNGLEWAQGGSGGGLLIKVLSTVETESLDKTWNQIYSAILSGSTVTIIEIEGDLEDPDNIIIRLRQIKYVGSAVSQGYGYVVSIVDGDGHIDNFTCNSPNDYPETSK